MGGDEPFIAFSLNKHELSLRFDYTCCAWIQTASLLCSDPFNIDRGFIAGSSQGPMVLFKVDQNAILPVSVLCAHQYPVSSIIQSLQINRFLSISKDGTLCVWCSSDTSCYNKYDKIVPSGTLHLSIHPSQIKCIWVWNEGLNSTLIDTSNGNKILEIPLLGITSFSFMFPSSSNYVREPSAVATTIANIKKIEISDNNKISCSTQNYFNFSLNEQRIATQYGILRITSNTFALCRYNSSNFYSETEVPNIDKHDAICSVVWPQKRYFCLGTNAGKFYIVEVNPPPTKDDKYQIIKITQFKSDKSIMVGDFDFLPDKGIVYCNSSFGVSFCCEDKFIQFQPSKSELVINIPNSSDPTFLIKNSNDEFTIENWLNLSSSSPKFSTNGEKITSLFTIDQPNHPGKYLILAGCADGTVSFYWPDDPNPIKTVDALCSPIIDFCILPVKIGGRIPILAIGFDGSCALIKWMDVVVRYPTSGFPISLIKYDHKQNLLFLVYSDGQIFAHMISESKECATISVLPPGLTCVYPLLAHDNVNQVSTCLYRLPRHLSSKVYTELKLEWLARFIEDPGCELTGLERIISKLLLEGTSLPKDDQNKLKMIVEEKVSFVLIGYDRCPTFFIPPFRLYGTAIYGASSRIAGTHYIALRILEDIWGIQSKTDYPQKAHRFLPLLIRFLESKDSAIRRSASLACANTVAAIPFESGQEFMNLFITSDSRSLTAADSFLISMILISQPALVPDSYHSDLCSFLLSKACTAGESADLALVILLDGFDTWRSIAGGDSLLGRILGSIVRFNRPDHVRSLFALVAGIRLAEFSGAFDAVVDEFAPSGNGEVIERLFAVTSQVAFTNIEQCGALGTLRIANVGVKFPKLRSVVQTELEKHCNELRGVVSVGGCYIVAVRGSVNVFKSGKLLFTHSLFDVPITSLHPSPDGSRIAAVAGSILEAKIFRIQPEAKFLGGGGRPIIEKTLKIESKDMAVDFNVEWSGLNTCNFVGVTLE